MDVYEVTGNRDGIDRSGVNFLSPLDSYENLLNAFVYRQILQSRLGFVQFANRLSRDIDAAILSQTTTAGTTTSIADLLADTGIQSPSIRSSEPNALIQEGSVVISVNAGAATWNDATTPGILTPIGGSAAAGTINYVTGQVVLHFTGAVAGALPIVVTFNYAPGLRVMGIFEDTLPDGTKDLLVVDKNYFYNYDAGTNQFVGVPFTSAVPIVTFGIVSNEDYVSGTTYNFSDGSQRFVFTGKGMDDVYFFDGTGVKRYTNVADNPDYAQPPEGVLSKATTVIFFGQRLNFFVPIVNGLTYQQGVLYSGIADAAGNGDKYNVPGSGILSCDTAEFMKGALILGDIVIMNLQRSNWALEKTRDAFNPYFNRKIPSVLGTDAGFSAVSWNYEVKSAGKTGMITTDGRQSLRFDNKIPYFTADDCDQAEFELMYGGFDRINGQFLFSYRSTESNLASITQDRVLVYNYEESTWAINDQRFSVFGQTDKGHDLTWDDIDGDNNPAWARMDETEEVWNKIGIEAQVQKTLAGDDLGFIYQINTDYDDYFVNITNITQAGAAVVTIDPSAFQIGDRVVFVNVEGMVEINSSIGTVTAATVTSIAVDIDSRNFTAYTNGGTVSKLIAFEADMIPFNPYRPEGRRVHMCHVEFQVNTNAGNMFVDFYIDEEEAPFKTALVVSPTATTKTRAWVDVAVDQEAEYITIVMRNESAGFQTIVTSVRMYCSRGGFTSS